MLPAPEVPELDALRRIAAEHEAGNGQGSGDALREVVCVYVRAVRARGASVEATLVAVRTALGVTSPDPFRSGEHRAATDGETDGETDWVARAVSWCIAEYYQPA